MFGRAGRLEGVKDRALQLSRKIKRRLQQGTAVWKNEWKDILGIALLADGSISIVRLHHGNPLEVKAAAKLPPVLLRSEEDFPSWLQSQADRIAACLYTEGWENIPRVYAVPADKMLAFLITLPPDMKAPEQKEAAYWELAARLEQESLDVESFAVASTEYGTAQNIWTAAVSREYLEQMAEAFQAAEIPLDEIVACPEQGAGLVMDNRAEGIFHIAGQAVSCPAGMEYPDAAEIGSALGAALGYAAGILSLEKRSVWLQNPDRPVERWNYRFLAASMTAAVCIFLCLLTGWDAWQLYTAQQENFQYQQELVQRRPMQKKMAALEKARQATEQKEQSLAALSRDNIPWRSVLIHFGTVTVDGVWLNGLEMKGKDVLQIDGCAVSYDAVADFVKAFEKDTAFFPHGPVLESSGRETGEKGRKKLPAEQIGFCMTIHL